MLNDQFDLGIGQLAFERGHSVVGRAFADIFEQLSVVAFLDFVGGQVVGVERFAVDRDFAPFAAIAMTGHAIGGVKVCRLGNFVDGRCRGGRRRDRGVSIRRGI